MWEAIVNVFVNILLVIYKLIGSNFGVAIILFTIVIRLVTHPLMASQIKSSTKMTEMQSSKQWQDMQKKYKDDKEKLAQEQMNLYKEMGVSPFASCLPTLIQFPIIIALYQSIMRAMAASPSQLLLLSRVVSPFLNSVFHIQLANLIPLNSKFLWMNLGQPERVYMFGIGVPVLALIVALTTYVQSKVTLPANTSNPGDQSAMMNKMMAIYMPLLLGYFALTFASGLSVYFITGNLVGIAQYALLGKVHWEALIPGRKAELQTSVVARKKK
jgi:YidC/Oxa1 family membrane protein insertase